MSKSEIKQCDLSFFFNCPEAILCPPISVILSELKFTYLHLFFLSVSCSLLLPLLLLLLALLLLLSLIHLVYIFFLHLFYFLLSYLFCRYSFLFHRFRRHPLEYYILEPHFMKFFSQIIAQFILSFD